MNAKMPNSEHRPTTQPIRVPGPVPGPPASIPPAAQYSEQPTEPPTPAKRRLWPAAALAAVALVAIGGVAYAVGQSTTPGDAGAVPAVSLAPAHGPAATPNPSPSGSATHRMHDGHGQWTGVPGATRYSYDMQANLDIDNQSGDGTSVVVKSARTSAAGFVVVYAADGTVLGQAPVSASSQPVTVPLTIGLTAGTHRLHAALWVDDGDGVFDPATDALVACNASAHNGHGRGSAAGLADHEIDDVSYRQGDDDHGNDGSDHGTDDHGRNGSDHGNNGTNGNGHGNNGTGNNGSNGTTNHHTDANGHIVEAFTYDVR